MTTYAVTDPATGEVLARFPTASAEQVERAAADAAHAQRAWSRIPLSERAQVLRQVARAHQERRDELARIIGREMGKAYDDALGEVDFCTAIYDFHAEHAESLLADEPIELLSGSGTAFVRRAPIGVILGIMPWNYPYYQVARFAAPNLLLGNTVLLKHAPQCPESAAALQSIFEQAGAPAGAYVNLYASEEQVAQLIADPRVRGVSLTGSERAGAAVAEIAGRHLKKVVLELGGSDPFILLSTEDLQATVDAAIAARLDNTGQACNAAKRFIVIDELYDAFVAALHERLPAAAAQLAPLSSLQAATRLQEQVDRAVAQGAQLRSTGEREGARFPAGLLIGVTVDSQAYREELFGPVAMIFRVHDEQEAIAVANDTPYGLGSYVFSTDPAQAARVADALEVGMVFVNGVLLDAPELPFGGVKRSGFGRELGRYGVDEFANKKLIRTV
ncbi:NAD-dependent succinate-semialdehyde dehydrogenase [Kineococcus sp. SYSU DK006]|uniref:NAD-dependent succinate-semialdehyde dehydrogenase n=1 Tax=Kineococcus sp. SYSU DK006 TaxID=3383127 RepID=UPI003D7F1733